MYELVLGKELPSGKWSTIAKREIYYKLKANEVGGVPNLPPVLRREALICRGRGKWTPDEVFHMRLAEMSMSNLVTEPAETERETDMSSYEIDGSNVEEYAEYVANIGITQKGFERIMATEEEPLSAADKKKGIKAFKAFLALDKKERATVGSEKEVTPWGLQQVLMRAGKQAKLTAFLNQPGNLSVNPEHKAAKVTKPKTKKKAAAKKPAARRKAARKK